MTDDPTERPPPLHPVHVHRSGTPAYVPQDNAEEIRRMFASISRRYDLLNRLLSLGLDRRWRRVAASRTLDKRTRLILDICAGTGDFGVAYLDAMDEAGTVVAADFCHEMLSVARGKPSPAAGDNRWFPCQADALHLPFRDGTFDLTCMAFGIRNVSDRDRALDEMVRVTREGGAVVTLEFYPPRAPVFGPIYRFYLRQVVPRVGRWISGSPQDAYAYLATSVLSFESPDEMGARMARSGLCRVDYYPFWFGAVGLHCGRKSDPRAV